MLVKRMKKGFSLFIKCFIVILAAGYAILLFLEFDRYENDERHANI